MVGNVEQIRGARLLCWRWTRSHGPQYAHFERKRWRWTSDRLAAPSVGPMQAARFCAEMKKLGYLFYGVDPFEYLGG